MTVPAHVLWDKGGHAAFVSVADDAVVVRSTTPAPPGARLDGKLGDDAVRIKSHGSKREADGSFIIKGRLLDANRALRERIAALAQPG